MIDVSIVTGTYNRLPHLQKMVNSVRNSVCSLLYEIILVDGGSVDGTIEWCKEQNDVTLIEQGELLGAVKAFNAGARAARGTYVILANDDIEFIDLSILYAFGFMQDDPNVGIGCFYQDRGGQNWHVEVMPAISPGGLQTSVYYGQVCIIPTWLGNEVGWWGDYLHTYGGDNEMSCNVLGAGYKVVPVECACIHDMRVHDELRKINQGDPRELHAKGKTHPDSAAWSRKWSFQGKVGPRLSMIHATEQDVPVKRRILYAPIYEQGHAVQRENKIGLRKALEKEGVVVECDYATDGIDDLYDKACALCPDLFVLQIQDANTFTLEVIRELKEDHPHAVFVSWNGDYHPENLHNVSYKAVMAEMNHAGHAVASIEDAYKRENIKWFYWQIGYEESDAEPNQATKFHDVVFLANAYSKRRKDLGQFLLSCGSAHGLDIGLYGIWSDVQSMGDTLYDFDAGRRIYRASRIAISDQQWPNATGYVSNRLFQSLAAGNCLVLQQYFEGMKEYLGLEENVHLACWEDFGELEEQIMRFLDDEDERKIIAEAGHAYMLENHSFDIRVKELMRVLSW